MRIQITGTSDPNLNLRLPSGLALNAVSALWLRSKLKEHSIHITRRQAIVFLRALRRYERSHPDWNLVEIDQADGHRIAIRL